MQGTTKTAGTKAPVITLDDSQLREHVSDLVRQSVEDTLNSLLDAEADELCNARKYEHTAVERETFAHSGFPCYRR